MDLSKIETVQGALDMLAGADEETLANIFRESKKTIAQRVIVAAAVVRLYDEQGFSLERLPMSARDLNYLRRVGSGSMIPDLLFSEKMTDTLRTRVARLPVIEQKKFAADEPVEVVSVIGDTTETRMIRPSELTAQQVYQLFGYDRVRTLAEQRTWIDERNQAAPVLAGPIVVDTKSKCIFVTGDRVKITAKEMAEMVSRFS